MVRIAHGDLLGLLAGSSIERPLRRQSRDGRAHLDTHEAYLLCREARILGAVDIPGTQEAALQVAELVEAKERVIAGAAEVPIVCIGQRRLKAWEQPITAVLPPHYR